MSQHSYSTQPDRLHSQAFSVEPRRTPLSQSVSAFDVTISSLVGVAASLCFVNLRLLSRGLYLPLRLSVSCLRCQVFPLSTVNCPLSTVNCPLSTEGRLPFPDAHSLLFVHERSCYSAPMLRSSYIDELTSIHQQQLRGGYFQRTAHKHKVYKASTRWSTTGVLSRFATCSLAVRRIILDQAGSVKHYFQSFL